MDKALNYLSLARKGGMAELGEEPVGAITRSGKGYLVIVASDASDHTWRRAKSFVAGTDQQCVRVPFTKEELGGAVGRTACAMMAVTDIGFAESIAKKLAAVDPEKYTETARQLSVKAQRAAQRRAEQRSHEKNVRQGGKKRTAGK